VHTLAVQSNTKRLELDSVLEYFLLTGPKFPPYISHREVKSILVQTLARQDNCPIVLSQIQTCSRFSGLLGFHFADYVCLGGISFLMSVG
jgi:hypothetical protein